MGGEDLRDVRLGRIRKQLDALKEEELDLLKSSRRAR
jgi:hypothetical protein